MVREIMRESISYPSPFRRAACAILFLTLAVPAAAQGTAEDYARAERLAELSRNKVFRVDVRPNWHPTRPWLWYVVATGEGSREFVFVDAERGERRAAFDHGAMASAFSTRLKREVRGENLPIEELRFDEEGATFLRVDGDWLRWNAEDRSLAAVADDDLPPAARRSSTDRRGDDRGETTIQFTNATDATVELFWDPGAGGLRSYGTLDAGDERSQHTFVGHVWVIKNAAGEVLLRRPARADAEFVVRTPRSNPRPEDDETSRRWKPFVRDFDLYVRDEATGEERRLSQDGTADDPYVDRFFVSPDGGKLIALRRTVVQERIVYLIESSPTDQTQPRLHEHAYAKPGDELAQTRPKLFDLETLSPIGVDEAPFANSYSVDDFAWTDDSSFFSCLFNPRGHQALRVLKIDAATGAVSTMIEETSPTFVDYSQKTFLARLDATGEAIWASERGGFNHLYLYDQASGAVKNAITEGPWMVRGVERIDREARRIWFWAMGIVPEQDPYFEHLCRVDFDGTNLTVLTEGDGTHEIERSPDGAWFIDRWSRVDRPTVTELRRWEDGALAVEVERGDATALFEAGLRTPIPFAAKGRDGRTDIHGVIHLPTKFDPAAKYPVVEQIYAGPHGYFVPKSFRAFHSPARLAELGFIVVQIDGMGTNWRGKAFHDVCWKNLGDGGFPDRIAWMRAAAEKYPAMDLSRVGIHGGSAGGQSAMRAVLAHGDFYRAAAADCGCHDNRVDKLWWNEAWMGWPVGPHYAEQSNVTQAHRLTGDLLLIVGELDRNVDPASTMQVVDALVRADKDFDLLVMPGAGHGIGSGDYGMRRTHDFFVRTLHGVEPRR